MILAIADYSENNSYKLNYIDPEAGKEKFLIFNSRKNNGCFLILG